MNSIKNCDAIGLNGTTIGGCRDLNPPHCCNIQTFPTLLQILFATITTLTNVMLPATS